MGLFCANLHFRTTDEKALSAAVERRGLTQTRVLPAKGGWTSLYEERASQQDDNWLRNLASGLSRELNVPAFAFLVHDSDIACYWLYDGGQLRDEYNSCPDYFDPNTSGGGPSGGQSGILLPYCRDGVREEDLTAILSESTLFAEDLIRRLAKAIGIDAHRAVTDYRDFTEGDLPDDSDGSDDGDDRGDGPPAPSMPAALASRVAAMFGMGASGGASADPQATALVEAAANDDQEAISRLLAAGIAVNSEAPAPLPQRQPMAGLAELFPGGPPKIPMTPLLAAVVNKRRSATEQLLDGGADPNHGHPLLGTPIHAAAGAGEVELLKMLIDRGGDVNARNGQGLTPLQVIVAGRQTQDRLAQAQKTMKSLGGKLPAIFDQLSKVTLPFEGWDACERLLKEHGAN